MIARGIPAEIILREDRAMNTGENVIFSLPIIDAALGLANIRSVICLGNSWTARRYPMTLHRHWPEVEKMLVMVDSFRDAAGALAYRSRIQPPHASEWDKIEPYKAKGFIAEWPVGEARVGRSIRSCRNLLLGASAFPPASAAPHRADRCGGAASASRTAFGACPGATANVVDGVNAMSRRAAAATKVCERQCGGSVSQR